MGDGALPNRSGTGWEVPELDETGGFPGKELQSPNSPFPLEETAAGQHDKNVMVKCKKINVDSINNLSLIKRWPLITCPLES